MLIQPIEILIGRRKHLPLAKPQGLSLFAAITIDYGAFIQPFLSFCMTVHETECTGQGQFAGLASNSISSR